VSVQKFAVASTNALLAALTSAQKLYFRSSNAADTGNLSLTGLVSASPTTETNALIGQREVLTANTFSSLTGAVLSAAQLGVVTVYGSGTAGAGFIIVSTQPANNDTILIGLTGFTQTYTFKTTLTGAANEVKIGADVSATASNLSAAINAGAGAGTTYGTGTAANSYISSTVSASLITITDKIPCKRQLAWSISQGVGATLGIAAPQGGVDGTLLASLAIGTTQAYNSFTLDSEDLVAATLPAKVAPTTDWIRISGKSCSLQFKTANVGTSIPLKYQTSTDSVNASDGATSISNLDDNAVLTPLHVYPAERNIEYIRLVFASNANTSDSALDAAVIF
jgi:hypothetical protein